MLVTRSALSIKEVQAERSLLKAARVKLGMEQDDLAKATGLHTNTIYRFESGTVAPHERTRSAIQEALEARGIVFTNGDKPGFYFDKDRVIIPT